MTLRPALLRLLFALPLLTGCAAGTYPPAERSPAEAERVELTAAEEARLAELVTRLEEVKAHPDSTLTRAEFEEIMRLRDKRDGIDTPTPQSQADDGPSWMVVIGTTLVVLFAALLISVNESLGEL